MPRIEKVEDGLVGTPPFRITRRKERRTSPRSTRLPRIRVKCGCCENAVEIYHDTTPTGNAHHDRLEINGVDGTVAQWRKVLLPLLGL